MPDNVVFELVIKGTPGTPEESDDHVLWIEADCPNTIRETLSREAAQCVRSIVKLPGLTSSPTNF